MLSQVSKMSKFLFCVWPGPISLSMCIYTHPLPHIFFIHSSVDGHLGYFCTLEIVNNAAMNIGMHVSFWISVFDFLAIYPGVELLGHMVVLFSVFWETTVLHSTVTASIYPHTNSVGGFPFLYILASICYLCSLWFWFALPWWLVILSVFSCVCWLSVCFLWKNVYSCPLPTFSWLVYFLMLNCMSPLYILDINPLSDLSFVSIFFHSVGYLLFCW